jgi:hypothetical protein
MHGHTLIWHADYQVPVFMKNYSGDFAAMLKNHVQSIVSHFQGKVVSWDVVNEALADDGEPSIGNNLRSTVFSQKMGLNFIDQAFINARAADPQADLYYNDYNIEAGLQKTLNMLALVDGMRSRGVPITGVGFQTHVSIDWPSISAIESSMKAVADRGLKVKISELDVSMKNAYTSFTSDAATRAEAALPRHRCRLLAGRAGAAAGRYHRLGRAGHRQLDQSGGSARLALAVRCQLPGQACTAGLQGRFDGELSFTEAATRATDDDLCRLHPCAVRLDGPRKASHCAAPESPTSPKRLRRFVNLAMAVDLVSPPSRAYAVATRSCRSK